MSEAVQSLTPWAQFSALKGNLMYALNAKWSMASKIEFFQRFAADSRRLAKYLEGVSLFSHIIHPKEITQ
jgi:hypothetical protein